MAHTSHSPPSLVVVANRLPFRRAAQNRPDPDSDQPPDTVQWLPSPGGLVSALAPSLEGYSVSWVGWAGDTDNPQISATVDGTRLAIVPLAAEDKRLHYDGMSNGTLWPLFHDKVAPVQFHRSWFEGYQKVNQRFADRTAELAEPNSAVWIHDYQLMLVPQMLRQLRPDLRIGYFLHIPFPPKELFAQLPWRDALVSGVLGSDLVGFQTRDSVANFVRVAVDHDVATRSSATTLCIDERTVTLKPFPIGIDYEKYDQAARSEQVDRRAKDLRSRLGNPHTVLLGVDRLDYTKGIDVRLRAFHELLIDGRLHPSQVTMVQVAEPSRDDVDAYVSLRNMVEQLVGEINGDFSRVGSPVVHYLHQTHSFEELLGLYRTADVMLVTPFSDGMNLVSKEYVATRYDNTGTLVLSEFAGAAKQLKSAVLVNPYNIRGVKDAIERAINLQPQDAVARMKKLRQSIKRNDGPSWARGFLTELNRPLAS